MAGNIARGGAGAGDAGRSALPIGGSYRMRNNPRIVRPPSAVSMPQPFFVLTNDNCDRAVETRGDVLNIPGLIGCRDRGR